ncbi:hypothetical protein K488DRAFT_52231 [Vararia minispora EC-137]|uniref:Uncharacterized protein n=1 Tax=Vararia minispora EC-137 TaxID=1314806 RepID=A0ACB8QIA4_9AGAM|nr:hypothetical protein K488DRAFT_52231 [Vararia minispora EC-137]
MPELTNEQKAQLKELAQRVVRAFYEPKYIIVIDQLVQHYALRDDQLAGRVGLQLKDLNKIMAVLEKDGLVQVYVHRQNELKDGAQRSIGKSYFYLDFKHFCDVVKWRVAEMRKIIDSRLRNELDNQGYICRQCKKEFSPLDVDKLIDYVQQIFVCDVCHGVVDNNEDDENVRGGRDRMQRFNDQMTEIREYLRKSEDMTMPKFEIQAYVAQSYVSDAAEKGGDGDGLKIAGASGARTQGPQVDIILTGDKDPEQQRKEREAAAAARRAQNALPEWHLKSTVSGTLTALGEKESALAKEAEAGAALRMQGDEALRGLGRAGPSTPAADVDIAMNGFGDMDVKPAIRSEPDSVYEQYYASLAASAAPTPFSASVSTPNDDEARSQLGDTGKRSRSVEDEGENDRNKHGRFENHAVANGETNGHDPIVYVNGAPIPFSRVTEDDHERMTPEEYSAFFDVMQAQSLV